MEEWKEQQDQVRRVEIFPLQFCWNLESQFNFNLNWNFSFFKLNVAIERIAQQIEELQDEQNEDNMFLNFWSEYYGEKNRENNMQTVSLASYVYCV